MTKLQFHGKTTAAALFAAAAFSCSTPHFQNVQKMREGYDAATGAYVVAVSFELLEGDLPVQGLSVSEFEIYEDDVRATSEAIQELDMREVKLPVTLLLDTSYSIYRCGAMPSLRRAAYEFVAGLRSEGFEVTLMTFDSTVETIGRVQAIPESFTQRPEGKRWTSLYYAIQESLALNENGILVVFSDGADNYSQNWGVGGIEQIRPLLEGRQVHVIGFGDVDNEHDRQGNAADDVLEEIAENGTYQYADEDEALSEVFRFIARRLRNLYAFEYYSPNQSGDHGLVIEYDSAETERIPFRASKSAQEPQPEPEPELTTPEPQPAQDPEADAADGE